MKIFIKVKTGSRTESVRETEPGLYEVCTKALPEKGKANADVVRLLAEHFKVPRNQVKIAAGHTARTKIVHLVTD